MTNRTDGRSSEELERTLYVANLDDRVTDEILYELMIQAGPVESVSRPKDRPFAFVIFENEESIPYSIALFRQIRLFDRQLDIRPRDGTEQARKIAHFMEEVRQKRRQLMDGNGNGDHRRSIGSSISMPPTPNGGSFQNFAYQNFTITAESSRYASSSNTGDYDRRTALGGPPEFGNGSRSISWPRFPAPAPPMPLMPPPPPPPPPPAKSDQRFGAIRDYSNKRRHDDRRYDEDEDEARYRSRNIEQGYQRRDEYYQQRESGYNPRNRDRGSDDQNGRRSGGSNRR